MEQPCSGTVLCCMLPKETSAKAPWRFAGQCILIILILFFHFSTKNLHAQLIDTDVGGQWIGSMDTVLPDGGVQPGSVYFKLQQKGVDISGSAGSSPTTQVPISAGKLNGDKLIFTVPVKASITSTFLLDRDQNRLTGTATGLPVPAGSHVVVDAMRAGNDWQTPQPIAHQQDRILTTVMELDRKLLNAYNTCDIGLLGQIVTDDLEFYHDKTGLATGRQSFLDSMKQFICGKVNRELTKGSVEVSRLDTMEL
jgi:hypothetical protein